MYLILDGDLHSSATSPNPVSDGTVVYEVVRLIDGKPLFWNDHYNRLVDSCRIAHLDFRLASKLLIKSVGQLVSANGVENVNFKVEVFKSAGQLHFRVFLLPSHYPDSRLYTSGVSLGLLREERNNPHAKIVNSLLRDKADRLIDSGGYYEVLLVNSKNEITEGSRSNVFFIQGNTLTTPPLNDVLPGITRHQVLQIAREMGLSIEEVAVTTTEIGRFESVFITGTSPMLLPACNVDRVSYSPLHPVFKRLLDRYRLKVAEDLNAFEY